MAICRPRRSCLCCMNSCSMRKPGKPAAPCRSDPGSPPKRCSSMLPDRPDFSRRASIVEKMDEPCSRDELRACLRDIARTNRWTLAYRPLLAWLDGLRPTLESIAAPVRILDVGSGYGDGLRRVEQWARENRIDAELRGLDLN